LKTLIPTERLQADVLAAVADRAFIGDDPLPRNATSFAEQVKRARHALPAVAEGAFALLATIAAEHYALTQRLNALAPAQRRIGAELRARRDALVHPGFFAGTPWAQLGHLPRYLRALDRRLTKHAADPARDARHAERWPTGGAVTPSGWNATGRPAEPTESSPIFAGCSRNCRCRCSPRSSARRSLCHINASKGPGASSRAEHRAFRTFSPF
jgi:hypothetical protein